jgi:hypothetical protein
MAYGADDIGFQKPWQQVTTLSELVLFPRYHGQVEVEKIKA